jgi:hypothetical protein
MKRNNNAVKTGLAFSITGIFDETNPGGKRITQSSQKIA